MAVIPEKGVEIGRDRMHKLAIYCVFGALALPAWSADTIAASVKSVKGGASVRRGTQTIAATAGMHLLTSDTLVTAADGSLGVIFQDGTGIGLGPNTEVKIESFLFEPVDSKFALVLRLARGVFAYFSGRIARFAPGSVSVETPVGVIGLRGTHLAVSIEGA